MSNYRRYFVPGGTFFFTVVTAHRMELFSGSRARRLLGDAMRRCFKDRPVEVVAMVLLPDHVHCLWSLPRGEDDYSTRWRAIKSDFTRHWRASGGREQPTSRSQWREGRRGVWQRRFWEHTIRDEEDLERHADYIHYNPVKHKLAASPGEWPWSTFRRWVQLGQYPPGWGRSRLTIELGYEGAE